MDLVLVFGYVYVINEYTSVVSGLWTDKENAILLEL